MTMWFFTVDNVRSVNDSLVTSVPAAPESRSQIPVTSEWDVIASSLPRCLTFDQVETQAGVGWKVLSKYSNSTLATD